MDWLKKISSYFYKYRVAVLIICAAGLVLVTVFLLLTKTDWRTLQAGTCTFEVEAVSSAAKQYQGLSGRKSLATNRGMLFLYEQPQDLGFVMRNMNFPLDIIFIRDHRIINLYRDLAPEGATPTISYHSGALADTVLEIPAGRSQECGLGVNSEIFW